MKDELIQLPDLKDIKEMLKTARHDIIAEVEQDAELDAQSKLPIQLIDIIEEKIAKGIDKIDLKEKIDVASHLNFLQCLLEDFFFVDEDFDGEFDEEFEEDFEDCCGGHEDEK
jgi:hypothetical protein